MTASIDIATHSFSRGEAMDWVSNEYGAEGRYYLERLQGKTAVIKVGGEIIQDNLAQFTGSIALLSAVGMRPIIVHGGGPQINTALAAQGIPEDKVDGKRVTHERHLPIIEGALTAVNKQIVDGLESRNVAVTGLKSEVFTAAITDAQLGQVGDVIDVNKQLIHYIADAGSVPVLSCFGADRFGHPLNINGDSAATALAKAMMPHRFLSVTTPPGVLRGEEVIPFLDASGTQIEDLIKKKVITGGMVPKTREAYELAQILPEDSLAVILSARGIISEFFTNVGSGTMVARGKEVQYHESMNAANPKQLRKIIDNSFRKEDKELAPDYFDNLPADTEYFDVPRMGFSIVFPGKDGAPSYLDKIVVTEEAKGKGITQQLIESIKQKHPEGIYWRAARNKDRLLRYYFDFAESVEKNPDWVVFLSNVPEDARRQAIHDALHRPASFVSTK